MGLITFVYVERWLEGGWWFAGEMEKHELTWDGFEEMERLVTEEGFKEWPPYQPAALIEAYFGGFGRALYIAQRTQPLFEQRGSPPALSAELASHFAFWEMEEELVSWATLDELLALRAEIDAEPLLYPFREVWDVLCGMGAPEKVRLVFAGSQ